MHAAAQCWQRQRGGARRRGRPGALAAAAPELSKTSRAEAVEGGGGEGNRRGDRVRREERGPGAGFGRGVVAGVLEKGRRHRGGEEGGRLMRAP